MNTRKAFLRSLVSIARGSGKSLTTPAATKAFRKALLDFGSETDDNQECAAEICVSTVRDGALHATGLALRRKRRLVSQILNDAEGMPVPARVRRRLTRIT